MSAVAAKAGKVKLSRNALLAVVVAGCLLVAALGWFLLVSPKRAEAASLGAEVVQLQAEVTAKRAAAAVPPLAPVQTGDLFRLVKAMPDSTDMSGILLELNEVARAAGVSFESITPGDVSPVGAYGVVPVTLVFEGTFYSLSDFLFRLRNLVQVDEGRLTATGRLFAIDNVSFAPLDTEGRSPWIQASVQLNAFVFGAQAEPAVAAPAAAAPAEPGAAADTTAATTGATTTADPTAPAGTATAPAAEGTG